MGELTTQHGGEREPAIERLDRIADHRRPDDHLFAAFLPAYYHELTDFDLDDRDDDDLYAVAQAHVSLGRTRQPGETLVRVSSPDRDRDGWFSERTVVLLVTDDAPFLVETVRIVLERHAVATHLLVHPMLYVRRDPDGTLVDVVGGPEPGAIVEAWTQVEIDRCDGDHCQLLTADLRSAVDLVHRVVADFVPMRDRMSELAGFDPLLEWLAGGNFVFLGAATYTVLDAGATIVPHSALGQLEVESALDPPLAFDGPPVSIARSIERASIHRSARMTVVSVMHEIDGKPVVDRFVGLLASTAYRQSVLTVPSVGDRARAVLGLAEAGAETHTGRSMRNVLETLPRDLVFELDADALAQLVIDVVGLQERQIVRVFDVPEPVGDRSTVLVFVPRQRFHARLPEQVAALVGESYGSTPAEIDSFLGSSNLARITFTVARTSGAEPDLDHVSALVDELTTSWLDRLRIAATHQLGEAAGQQLVARVGDAAPESYRSSVPPSDAVGDFVRMLELVDADEATRTALTRHVDDVEGDWRMRVYRREAPIALAELLPMLGHVGLRALEERPYQLVIEGHECFVYDIGVRVPPGVAIDDQRHANVRSTFEGLLSGDVEPDGFNRLVLFAGLSAAQANLLRCYAKYASQIGFTFSQGYIQDTLARLPQLAMLLVELFEARFDPDLDSGDRIAALAVADSEVLAALDAVPSLDDDRIGRMFLSLIRATVRTSAYQGKPTIAFKFDPALIPDLPAPRPQHEIFVCSSRVEGVHLRGGAIRARWPAVERST